MPDQPVVLAVASYPSRAAADRDFGSLWAADQVARSDHVAAAVLQKGSRGELEMNQHRSTAFPGAFELLGAALTVVAAPLGLAVLSSALASRAEWNGAAAIVGRFWYDVPRDLLRMMGNVLEAGQIGIILVVVGGSGEDVAACLCRATKLIVSEPTRVDLLADQSNAESRG